MKRQPLEALGLTPEQIGAVLNMYHADMDKARAEHFRTHKATETRAAIARMLHACTRSRACARCWTR